MSKYIRLITDEATIHFANVDSTQLLTNTNYILPLPTGKMYAVCFASHVDNSKQIHPLVQTAIKNDIGVIYVCEQLPANRVIDPHVIYIVPPAQWFTQTIFMNPLQFKAVFSDFESRKLARAFSLFTTYNIPLVHQVSELTEIGRRAEEFKNRVLLEITGGVGDCLMCIPTIKTFVAQGKKVSVLVNKRRTACFENLDYITDVYTHRSEVKLEEYDRIIDLHFGQTLSDYRSELNKQNRIYAVAQVCGIPKQDLVTDVPEIILTPEELENAKQKYGKHPHKLFFGFDSDRVDARLPVSLAQEKINEFKAQGFTVFTASLRNFQMQNCIQFMNGELDLREIFAMIAVMDYVVTIDTGFLHIAGALNKRTFALMNYFDPSWRCSTYKNCTALTPLVSCHPCVARQFVPSSQWQCHKVSCFTHFNWTKIYKELALIKSKVKTKNTVPETVKILNEDPLSESSKHILVCDADGLGDVLMLTPSLKTLFDSGHTIDVVTRFPAAFENLPYVRNVYDFKVRDYRRNKYNRRYEVSYKLSQYESGWCRQHRVLSTAHILGITEAQLSTKIPEIVLSEKEKQYAQRMLGTKKTLVIAFTSEDAKREYPRALRQPLIDRITSSYPELQIVLVGDTSGDSTYSKQTGNTSKYSNCLDLRDKTSIRELFAIIGTAHYCLSIDSGCLHVAGAMRKPTIFLPSTINGEWRSYPETIILPPPVACYPCNERNPKCPNKFNAGWCMGQVPQEKIIESLRGFIYEHQANNV